MFESMHLLKIDLGKDAPSESSNDFLALYLSDNPKERSCGLRKYIYLNKEKGIIATTGEDFFVRSTFAFVMFVSTVTAHVGGTSQPIGFTPGCRVGHVFAERTTDI